MTIATQDMENFRFFLLKKGLEESTVRLHIKLTKRVLSQIETLTKKAVDDFVSRLLDLGRNIRYINQYIVAIRYYGQYKNEPALLEVELLKERRNNRYLPAIMSDEEIDAFLHVPNPYPVGSVFWRKWESWTLFWMICAYHGPRMGEVAKLKKEDISGDTILFNEKTGVRRVPISFVVKDRLLDYLKTCGEYLFPCIRRSRLPHVTEEAWQFEFKKRIRLIGLAGRKNIVPYVLRHSFATRMVDQDVSIAKIQLALGQKQLSTTEKYIHLSTKSVQKMIDNDRLSESHRSDTDVIQIFRDVFNDLAKRFSERVSVDLSENDGGLAIEIKKKK